MKKMRWCFSGGHISPPPPLQRKLPNPSTSSLGGTAGPSSSSTEPTSSGDEDQKLSKISPIVAPKPYLDDANSWSSMSDEKKAPERSDRFDSSYGIGDVSWRLQRMGIGPPDDSVKHSQKKGFTAKGHGLHWPSHLESVAQGAGSSNESESGSVLVNTATVAQDEPGSSSPSSSGIVADINDSNGESNQRTSVTSSLSSCEPSVELIDSGYDTPRPGRTCRPRVEDTSTGMQEHHQESSSPLFSSMGGTFQRTQLGQIREPSRLMMPTLEEKTEPSSTSVLQNAFSGLAGSVTTTAAATTAAAANATAVAFGSTVGDDEEPKFGHSFSFDNERGYLRNLSRNPSLSKEGTCGSVRFNSEDQLKYGGCAAAEYITRHRSLESGVSSFTNEENTSRKQTVCSMLTKNYRLIEIAVKKLDECTAARAWRQPHILQQHIPTIKENVETIANAMNGFLDAACRVSVDVSNPKANELKQLLTPLQNSNSMIAQLKQNLDSTGWTLSALSRPRNIYGTTPGSDALDQFLAVIKQLSTDCCKLIQWTLMLVPSSGIRFLTTGLKDSITADNIMSSVYQPGSDAMLRLKAVDGSGSPGADSKRHSTVSTASSMTISSLNDFQTPSSTLDNRAALSLITDSAGKLNRITFADNFGRNTTHRLSSSILEGHVLEEDDLESVVSDRDSFYQEYALAGDDGSVSRRRRPVTCFPPAPQLDPEVIKSLSEDDRQLIRFYSPQLDTHTEFLSKAIDEFLIVVEEQMPPHEFVQKGKLIILAAHKLIYIGDNIAQCISASELSAEVRTAADRLCSVLKNCVQATKHAADEYRSVSAMQTMVDCIVTVSRAAHDLKLLVKQCCI